MTEAAPSVLLIGYGSGDAAEAIPCTVMPGYKFVYRSQVMPRTWSSSSIALTSTRVWSSPFTSRAIERIVALHPYATHPNKAWPRSHWTDLAAALTQADLPWVVIGRDEHPLFPGDPRDLTGATNLRETCAILKSADLLVTGARNAGASRAEAVMEQAEIEDQIQKAKQKIEKRYVAKMNGYDNFEIEVREGIPYVEILKFAREKTGDLIVMAHHTREVDPEKAVLGSTVEQVVLRSACPVASVNHPDKVADL